MGETLPNIDQAKAVDTGMQLALYRPGAHEDTPPVLTLRGQDLVDIQVAFPRRAAGAMTFTVIASDENEFQKLLHANPNPTTGRLDEYTIAVRVYDHRRSVWVEPDNARFVVDRWENNIAQNTNHFTYTCRPEILKTNGMVLGRTRRDAQLNREYNLAKKVYDDTEREYDSLVRSAHNTAIRVQRDRFGHSRGRKFIGVRGVNWILREHREAAIWGMLVADTLGNRLLTYRATTGQWVQLAAPEGSPGEELLRQAHDIRAKRGELARRRDALARADRARRESSRDGTRYFYHRHPGRVLFHAWTEGAQRDASRPGTPAYNKFQAKGMARDWTATRHSKNGLWHRATNTAHWEFPLGMGFFDMVLDFQEKGEIDWTVRKRTLSIVPAGHLEVNQTRRVVLRLDQTVTEARESGDRSQHHSVTFVRTGNGFGHFLTGSNEATNITPWGWTEASVSETNANSEHEARILTRKLVGEALFREVRNSSRSLTIGQHSPIPMVDFAPHHWVSVYGHEGSMSRRIVDQVVLRQSGEGPLMADVELGQRRSRSFVNVGRTLSKLLGGIDHIQGHIPSSVRITDPEVPTEATYTPPLSDLTASLRHDFETGRPTVVIRASWAEADINEPADAGEDDHLADIVPDDGSDE